MTVAVCFVTAEIVKAVGGGMAAVVLISSGRELILAGNVLLLECVEVSNLTDGDLGGTELIDKAE